MDTKSTRCLQCTRSKHKCSFAAKRSSGEPVKPATSPSRLKNLAAKILGKSGSKSHEDEAGEEEPPAPVQPSIRSRPRRREVEVSLPASSSRAPPSQPPPPAVPPSPTQSRSMPAPPSPSQTRSLASQQFPQPYVPRRGPPSVASRTSPLELSEPSLLLQPSPRPPYDLGSPALPPASPYSSYLSASSSSLAPGPYQRLRPGDPEYDFELERVLIQCRRSEESLRIEREASRQERELHFWQQAAMAQRHQEELDRLRQGSSSSRDAKAKRRK